MRSNPSVVLSIPDLHCPFEHEDSVAFLKEVRKIYRPTEVVCLGDEADKHALGDYDTDPDGLTAGRELVKAIEHLQPIYKLFPEVMVCTSNHTARVYRRAFKSGIPRAYLKEYRDFMEAPNGWEWRDDWEVKGVIYEHGEGFTGREGAIKSALGNMQPTVIGHIHSFAGVQFSANKKHLIFGVNSGCLIDAKKYAFAYGKKQKSKPILGCSIIIDGLKPMFIPMLLNKFGRWVGHL